MGTESKARTATRARLLERDWHLRVLADARAGRGGALALLDGEAGGGKTSLNPAELTGRELEVRNLVREGLSDVEIAQKLYLSRKTVNHHVSAILRKLGVSRRGQAVAEAARLGLP